MAINQSGVRSGKTLAWGGVLAAALLCVSTSWGQLPFEEKLPKRAAEEWRKLYPFLSLEERLAHDANRAKDAATPKLSAEVQKRLDSQEKITRPWRSPRLESLKKLHSAEVEEFIKREGNGLERVVRPSVRQLQLPAGPSIPFGAVSYQESTIADEPPVPISEKGGGAEGPNRLPSVEALLTFHDMSRFGFLNPESFGFVKDKKSVAGFESHQFRRPAYAQDFLVATKAAEKGKDRWVLRRLELVSLLKHETPAVYVTDQLPRMEDLKNAPKRALGAFEKNALKTLQDGEDLVTEATPNRIRMMGSLRASKECLQCHSGPRGTLLGGFSYEMLRDPMLAPR